MAQPLFAAALDQVNNLAKINSQETDLVLLREKAVVSPIVGDEDLALKTSNVTVSTFVKNFNKLLFEKTSFDTPITNYEEFLKKLTPQDKTLLVYALALSSFKKLGTVGHVCKHCEEEFPADIVTEELWHDDSAPSAWDHDLSPFEYEDRQTFLDGNIEIYLKIPTEFDRIKLMDLLESKVDKNMTDNGDIFGVVDTIAFFTSKIIIKGSSDNGKVIEDTILTDLNKDILPFLNNLPLKIKDILFEDIDLTVFDKYMPNLYQDVQCTRCHQPNVIPVNIETSFFRRAILLFQ